MKKNYWIFPCLSLILVFVFAFPIISFARYSPRRNISIEPRWGYYVMDTSKWKERVYGRKYGIIGGLKTNMEFFHQVLQLGIGIGYMRENEPRYYIYNIPLEATINIRLKFSPQQLIVPYVGAGMDYSYFKEKGRDLDPNSGEIITVIRHNNRSGYHINAGLQLLLNRFDENMGLRFDEKFGVNATYLTLEARYSDLTNFDKLKASETDASGWFYYMGILFEF